MKLRNKSEYIGEDKPKGRVGTLIGYDKQHDAIKVEFEGEDGGIITCLYRSLAELNAEWEDYEPPMPKIENKAVRKIIREWAEVCGVKEVEFYCYGEESEFVDKRCTEASISFNFPLKLEEGRTYTITELCGEEE